MMVTVLRGQSKRDSCGVMVIFILIGMIAAIESANNPRLTKISFSYWSKGCTKVPGPIF
jgi:hypothetical protein